MGGCRCTYRNCTVKTDGKTHLFHYPVFDKVRCHQWLQNAQRHDFLNLKVSQVKNRVVCQNHFTDDMFMNYKHDRLVHNAVPTINGPYCTAGDQSNTEEAHKNLNLSYFIEIEPPENDTVLSEKIEKFPVKYVDYLINPELISFEVQPEISESKTNSSILNTNNNDIVNLAPPSQQINKSTLYTLNNQSDCVPVQTQKEPKVKIISEEKITEPLNVKPSLVPVSPSCVIQISKRNKSQKVDIKNETVNEPPQNMHSAEATDPIPSIDTTQNDFKVETEEFKFPDTLQNEEKLEKAPKNTAPRNNSLLSIKNSSPRIIKNASAIAEKRKFNMKLRDIISDILNTEENADKSKTEIANEPTSSYLSNGLNLPSESKNMMSYLEAKMQHMENILLSRIDSNTVALKNIRKLIEQKKPSQRSVSTQTKLDPKTHKKQLYQDISQYLSTETNSLLYEELFINDSVKEYSIRYNTRNNIRRKK